MNDPRYRPGCRCWPVVVLVVGYVVTLLFVVVVYVTVR